MHIKPADSLSTCTFCLTDENGSIAPDAFDLQADEETQPFQTGLILSDRYLLERVLGQGGMGQVFAARDLRLERMVAIKVVRHRLTREEELERILAREARLGASLNHRGIAAVYDFGFQGSRSYTVFEFIEGETLRQIIARRQPLPVDETLAIARELAISLDFAHAHGVVHRDLKPENICCARSGELKILDLGLARDIHAELRSQRYSGTPAYSSPEQCACQPTDGKSDQYALGLIVFEMLAGRKVFLATHPMQFLEMHRHTSCPSVREFVPSIPSHLDRALSRALNKSPEDRFATCQEFVHELTGPLAPSTRAHMLFQPNEHRQSFYLAHGSDQTPLVRKLASLLEYRQHRCWIFSRDALPRVASEKQVRRAIESSQVFVAILSRSTLRSISIGREIQHAHDLNIPILPLVVDMTVAELQAAAPAWYGWLSSYPPIALDQTEPAASASQQLLALAEQLELPKSLSLPAASQRPNPACGGPTWVTDANLMEIESLEQLLFRNGAVNEFLNNRHKHFISAPKGFGKTLLLTCKRQLLAESGQQMSSARFIPEGKPFLDFMSEMRSLSARYEEPLTDLTNTKRWWSAALRVSAISHHAEVITDEDKYELTSFPARFVHWLQGSKVQPTVVFKELTSLSVSDLNQLIDASENFLDLKMRQIHGTSWFFIDKVDQAIRNLSREAWIAIQAGLIEAAWETMNANSHLKIYASIRQEAFTNYRSDIKSNLFSATTNLNYSESELHCIVDQLASCYEGCQSFKDFLGLSVINHPKRPAPEDSFKYVRRHTSGRPRDLVAIASALSPRRDSLTDKELRQIVQQTSANVLVSNVFDEVRAFLNCLHTPESRLDLLTKIPGNILDKAEAIHICEQFNGLAPGTLHHFGENSDAISHPFRDLFFTGLLGTLSYDQEESVSLQRFRRASDPLSSSAFDLPDSAFYLIHPALDTFIRGQNTRGSFLQYQHIIVGEDLPWEDYYPTLMQFEKHLRGVNDNSFCQLAHEVVRHIQELLQVETSPYARLQVEYSPAYQRLRSADTSNNAGDVLFWIEELLDFLGKR